MRILQLTVRGLDDDTAERLRQHALETGTSLSQAALDLIRRGAGLTMKPAAAPSIGHSLDPWFGNWSAAEAEAVAQATASFAEIDPELWR